VVADLLHGNESYQDIRPSS
jgi:hypothetical protein